jgi:hypothetical protein
VLLAVPHHSWHVLQLPELGLRDLRNASYLIVRPALVDRDLLDRPG